MNWKNIALTCAFFGWTLLAACSLPTAKITQPTTAAAPLGVPTLPVTVIPVQQPTAAPTLPPAPAPAATAAEPQAIPTTTAAPLPMPGSTPTSSSPSVPFKAQVAVDAIKLRTGPGTLFPAMNLLTKGDVLNVYGRSAGDEWIFVETPQGKNGWVFALLLDSEKDLKTAPQIDPAYSLVVRGRVVDKSGSPVNGIQFALQQGNGKIALRTDATTDASGTFYAFFPSTAGATWTVSYIAISCTSRVMDQNCSCQGGACGTVHPASQNITFPLSQDLAFTWE